MQKGGRQPLLIAFLVCECDYLLRTHKNRACRHPPDSTVHTAVHPRLYSGLGSCLPVTVL